MIETLLDGSDMGTPSPLNVDDGGTTPGVATAKRPRKRGKRASTKVRDVLSGKADTIDFETAASIHRALDWPPPFAGKSGLDAPTEDERERWSVLGEDVRSALWRLSAFRWNDRAGADAFIRHVLANMESPGDDAAIAARRAMYPWLLALAGEQTNTPSGEQATSPPPMASPIVDDPPGRDPNTIRLRVEEMVREARQLVHEVCELEEQSKALENHSHWLDHLELAHHALARCIAGPEAVEAEGLKALERMEGMPGIRRALLIFAATLTTGPGLEGYGGSLLPDDAVEPKEPPLEEVTRVAAARSAARLRRRADTADRNAVTV